MNESREKLHAHLNSAARHSSGWDILQFRVEEADEANKGRKVDLVAAPCGIAIWIEVRRYSDFEALLPIECKRLPTPRDKNRDEREYVISRFSTTGGIQRFKQSLHGSAHSMAAMIAYVQQDSHSVWFDRVCGWITDLVSSGEKGWSKTDQLRLESYNAKFRTAIIGSCHTRAKAGSDINLRHFWLEMN